MSTKVNPLEKLAADRQAARAQNDAWAALCTLGTVNEDGDAEQRTLVLRDHESRLALFFSAHSPKWRELQGRPTCSVQLYLPSIQVQYRVRASWEVIDPQQVFASWVLRPDVPKKLDWLYEQHPQSSAIDRSELLAQLDEDTNVPEHAPETAMGVFLNPVYLERLQLSRGVHERESWTHSAQQQWVHQHLVP